MNIKLQMVAILSIVFLFNVKGQKIDNRQNNAVFQHGLNQYLQTIGDSYKIDGYGIIIVEIESSSFDKEDDSWFQNVSELSLIFYPVYQSSGIVDRPPNTMFQHRGHLFCLYSGTERLIEQTLDKKALKTYKKYFSDLNGRDFMAGAEMVRIRLSANKESVVIERDVQNWEPTLSW